MAKISYEIDKKGANPMDVLCVQVMRQGNSLVVPVTKFCKENGIVPGDEIMISISKVISKTITYDVPDFDPRPIGDKIIKAIGKINFTPDELRSYVRKYDGDPQHVEAIIAYIQRNPMEG